MSVRNQDFIDNGCCIGSSHLGSRRDMLEMFDLVVEKGIESWVEEVLLSKSGLQKAMNKLETSSVRYRSCMVSYDQAFNE